jgi:chemotaxis signal transduction protein
MARSNAWILDVGGQFRAAVGGRELLHLIDVPKTFAVPCTPSYCKRVIVWQGRLLAVMDMTARLTGTEQQAQFIAVVAYQHQRGEYPEFGALLLVSPPVQVTVSDEEACQLPEEALAWKTVAISCFLHQGEVIPVLDLRRIFQPVADQRFNLGGRVESSAVV